MLRSFPFSRPNVLDMNMYTKRQYKFSLTNLETNMFPLCREKKRRGGPGSVSMNGGGRFSISKQNNLSWSSCWLALKLRTKLLVQFREGGKEFLVFVQHQDCHGRLVRGSMELGHLHLTRAQCAVSDENRARRCCPYLKHQISAGSAVTFCSAPHPAAAPALTHTQHRWATWDSPHANTDCF